MREAYLEVTFRHGRALAAYLYLPRQPGALSTRSERRESGLVIDYEAGGQPIGIEITAPGQVSLSAMNRVLADLGLAPVTQADLAPLQAA
jgi:Protein of unknown function (DUF2283)